MKNNIRLFPRRIGDFRRPKSAKPKAGTTAIKHNYILYTAPDGRKGYVTASDLLAGKRQVRKIKFESVEQGPKVAVPSEQIWG
jgi:hypothetical protein